jgi:hypothetical protein
MLASPKSAHWLGGTKAQKEERRMVKRGSVGPGIGPRIGKIRHRIEKTLQRSAKSAQAAGQTAASTAKQGLDQILLGLQHNKLKLIDTPQDIIHSVGRKVLERAEAIRAQLAEQPLSPSWLKDVNLTPQAPVTAKKSVKKAKRAHMPADEAVSMTEASVSEAAAEMQPETHAEVEKKAKKNAVRKVATKGARPKSVGAKTSVAKKAKSTKTQTSK